MGTVVAFPTPAGVSKKAIEEFRDPRWRLRNLYFVKDENGNKVKFSPNWAQEDFFEEMWFLNLVLKSRQLGFCLDPKTRVLTADLQWRSIASLRTGDSLVAVDEYGPVVDEHGNLDGGPTRSARRMRTAVVEAVVKVRRKAYRISFEDGRSVVCTAQHPWLSRKVATGVDWRSIEKPDSKKKLTVGTKVRWVTKPWGAPDVEDGWFGGMLDGEGSFSPRRFGNGISVSQLAGPVFDRLLRYCESRGYHFRIEKDAAERPSKFGKQAVPKVCVGRMDELFRLIGQCRPTRFIGKCWWEGRELPGKRNGGVGWATITAIEPLGEQTMVDLQTSTGTYIAEGFVSHNTTAIDLFMLDAALFNPNVNARVIADSDAKAKEIFEDKIRFAYNNLPDWLRQGQETEIESMHALKFANGSSVRVGTSTRGLTEQYLHVSELGKISLDFPKKAQEIKTGAFNTVHAGNFIFVESTAKGRGGVFFELCDMATKAAQAKRELTRMSWKLHFYPWYVDPRCALSPADAKKVVIPDEAKEYFDGVEAKMEVELTLEQKAWYVVKAQTMGDKMKEEFPSTPEEPFEVPLEGAYFGKSMVQVRAEGRICRLPWLPALRVNAFLDIGKSDYTSIWLHQHVYPWNHFLAYYQNSGEKVAHYVNWIRNKAMDHGCVLGTIYLPHDAASDHADTENTYEAQVRKLLPGVNIHVVDAPNDKYYDGIQATRRELPSCKFDAEGCDEGIRVLENYRKQWNDLLGVWRNEPLHDWASHGSDAFEQFARGFVAGAQKGFKRGRHQRGSHRTV